MHRLLLVATLCAPLLSACVEPPDAAPDEVRDVLASNFEHFRSLSSAADAYVRALQAAGAPAELAAAVQTHHPPVVAALHGINKGYGRLAQLSPSPPRLDDAYQQVQAEGEARHEALRGALVKALRPHREDPELQAAVPGLEELKQALFEQRVAYAEPLALLEAGELAPIAEQLPGYEAAQRDLAARVRELYFLHPYLELLVTEVYTDLAEAQRVNLGLRERQREQLGQLLRAHADDDTWCEALVPRQDLEAHLAAKADNIGKLQTALEAAGGGAAIVAALEGAVERMIAVRSQDHDWARLHPLLIRTGYYTVVCPDLAALQARVDALSQAQRRFMQEAAQRYKLDRQFAEGMARVMTRLQAAAPEERPE